MNATFAPGAGRVIAIIGGGFSGTVLAAYLLREVTDAPLRIVLVERQQHTGCGVAYAERSFPYLLNVPAGRMSVVAADNADFLRFAQRRLPDATADAFLPRHIYGDYLRDVLHTAEAAAPASVHLERLQGETTSIHAMDAQGPLIVSVGTRQLLADQVILACGDPPPVPKRYAADLIEHPAYVVDPYQEGCIKPGDRAALLIGTGLTMADVAIAAAEQNPNVRLAALSRHGLLSRAQREGFATVLPASLQLDSRLAGLPLRGLVRSVRALIGSVQEQGGDWREVVGRLREIVPQLWQSLGEADRRRFVRHVRVYWDVHRHRMAPATAERIAELQRSGRLTLLAGCVTQLCADGERIVALWRPRGRYETRELWVDRVVECSGSDRRLQHSPDGLWRQLLNDGIATVDAAGVGLRTGTHGALIDVHGRASARLFYLGPMLRAAHWEATAAGELRVHARSLAAALAGAGGLAGRLRRDRHRARGGHAAGESQEVDSAII